ncbi:MAG: DNA-directed RNA polymerase subunit alpha C-terminal domain-containing protein [Candidatus Aenigmarchaeota archaeon]
MTGHKGTNYGKFKSLSVEQVPRIYASIGEPLDNAAKYIGVGRTKKNRIKKPVLHRYRNEIKSGPKKSLRSMPKPLELKLICTVFDETIPYLSDDINFLPDQITLFYSEETLTQMKERLYEVMEKTLTPREKLIIGMRYALEKTLTEDNMEDVRVYDINEIQDKLDVSVERIFSIRRNALKKLDHQGLREFFRKKTETLALENIQQGKYGNGEISHLLACIKHYEKRMHSAIEEINSLDRLNISTQERNILRKAGIKTITYLDEQTDEELLEIRDFGKKRLQSVKKARAEIG